MDANELFDRYIHKVGESLNQKTRADIQLELGSLLQDALEARSAKTGEEPTAQMAADILREFGNPETIAAGYQSKRYVIGPALYPIFRLVITLVVGIQSGFYALVLFFILTSGDGYLEMGQSLWSLLMQYGRTVMIGLGAITLSFAVAERFIDVDEYAVEEEEDWDPFQLPVIKDSYRINRPELIASIIFLGLMVFSVVFFSDWIGFFMSADGDSNYIALLAPEFARHIPWLTASWILEIMLKGVVLTQGSWTKATRLVEVLTDLFGFYVLTRLFNGRPLVTISALDGVVHWVIGLVMLIVIIEVIGKIIRLARGSVFFTLPFHRSKPA